MDSAALRGRYGPISELAAAKVLPRLDVHARTFIELSPFVILGSADAQGNQDVSPRGDPPGFVTVLDDATLAIPDRPGNRRLDSLGNIIDGGRVGLLFLIPGITESLRVNGRARLSAEPELLARLAVRERPALSAIVVEIDEVFLHCGKALVRSRLWEEDARIDRARLPSLGTMIADQIAGVDSAAADKTIEADYLSGLY